ncbi:MULTISPECIES: HAD family hydrolase [unclassified Kitasatospora]|uniref:HAD family hydrolase n=1 Tax=unclassified Kitasatospora TaxID=2633591 RepID=UPI000539C465|nr:MULTISPECIES: haloacid dehalogenase-like hydrolase [unclassified Kitasatospora]
MPLIILWDIDHTLIDNAGVSKEIYAAAFEAVAGYPPSSPAVTEGRTDRLIMGEMFRRHGRTSPGWDIVEATLEAAGRERLDEIRRRGHVLPGARETLSAVAEESQFISSVLTGNIAANARTKLAAFGLDGLVDLAVGAYGADDPERKELVAVAQRRVSTAYGVSAGTPVVLVGDTPRDVEAALSNGAEIVAVATGAHTGQELQDAGADVVLASLTGTEFLLNHFRRLANARG